MVGREGAEQDTDQTVLIVWMDEDWDSPPVGFTRRRMLLALADYCADKGATLLCIDRPRPPGVRLLFSRQRFQEAIHRRDGVRWVRDNLALFSPRAPLLERAASLHPLLNIPNAPLLRWQMDRFLTKLGWAKRRRAYVLFHPYQASLLPLMRDGLVAYECYDEYAPQGEQTRFSNPSPFSIRTIKALEDKILARADVVIATAEHLADRCRQTNANTHLLHNGVDYERFFRAQAPHPETAGVPRPIIGFAGTFKSIVDIDLLVACARARPDWSFVFLGPEDGRPAFQHSAPVQAARRQPNIHFWGVKPEEDVPEYMRAFDVCLVPYATHSDFAVAVYPLKINEYFAQGKPVVATDYLQDFSAYQDVLYIARAETGDFVQKLEAALAEQDEAKRKKRQAIAHGNSWHSRAARLWDILVHNMNERRH